MADTKINDLDTIAATALADTIPVVDDTGGTPVTKKITVENLVFGAGEFGHIYVDDASASQTISSGTPEKITAFVSNGASGGGVTADAGNDKLTIANTGIYLVNLSFSFSGDASITWELHVYWNGVEQAGMGVSRKIGSGGDTGAGGISGLIDVSTGATDIEFYAEPDGASKAAVFNHLSLSTVRVGLT